MMPINSGAIWSMSSVDHHLPHDRRVEKSLLHRWCDAHDDLGRQLWVGRADRLHRDNGIGRSVIGSAERQDRGALAVGARAVDHRLEHHRRRSVGHREQRAKLDADERARLAGQHPASQDVAGPAVMLADAARLVDAEDKRPRRGIGEDR
jgi:hypothetical protein